MYMSPSSHEGGTFPSSHLDLTLLTSAGGPWDSWRAGPSGEGHREHHRQGRNDRAFRRWRRPTGGADRWRPGQEIVETIMSQLAKHVPRKVRLLRHGRQSK